MADQPPAISDLQDRVILSANALALEPQILDTTVTISDLEGDFTGGRITFSGSGFLSGDSIALKPSMELYEWLDPIVYPQPSLRFMGQDIGTFSAFNSTATTEAMEAIFEHLAFNTTIPTLATRHLTVTLTLTDGAGNQASHTLSLIVANLIEGTPDAEVLTGTDLGEILLGDAGNDELYGSGGADSLVGDAGADAMHGGFGDDEFFVDSALDSVFEAAGEGHDRVAAAADHTLAPTSEVEVLEAVTLSDATALSLGGSDLANRVIGNAGANTLRGHGGDDVLQGLGGDDVLAGDAGSDLMYGGAGNDTYYVDASSDVVVEQAGQGNDRIGASASYALSPDAQVELLEALTLGSTVALDLTGSSSANLIVGNDGANVLDGKGGGDVLAGLGGADVFNFTTALNAGNVDRVDDFEAGADRIALDDAIVADLNPGSMDPNRFVLGPEAEDADDRVIYDPGSGALLFDHDGSGAGAAVPIAMLAAGLALAATDLIIV